MTITHHATGKRDVRVTERKSVLMPFVAPELSPVPLLARELEKGKTGWTDGDSPEIVNVNHGTEALKREQARSQSYTCGDTVSRKAPPENGPRVRHPRSAKGRWAKK